MFSVVIPTRNRPALLQRALASVLGQSFAATQAIVVVDGAPEALRTDYAALEAAAGPRASFIYLADETAGLGAGHARNRGVRQATQEYVGFLDDDDEWTDADYLSRAAEVLRAGPGAADLHLADQCAIRGDGTAVPGPVWTEDLPRLLGPVGPSGFYQVPRRALLQSQGFCHLNTLLIRRAFFEQLGGFDLRLRYSEDQDLFLRAIDATDAVRYLPRTVARHNVPDHSFRSTAAMTDDERTADQLRLLDKAIQSAVHADIRAYAMHHKAYALKRMAQRQWAAGRAAQARFYAREALGASFNLKWAAYTAWLLLRSVTR